MTEKEKKYLPPLNLIKRNRYEVLIHTRGDEHWIVRYAYTTKESAVIDARNSGKCCDKERITYIVWDNELQDVIYPEDFKK